MYARFHDSSKSISPQKAKSDVNFKWCWFQYKSDVNSGKVIEPGKMSNSDLISPGCWHTSIDTSVCKVKFSQSKLKKKYYQYHLYPILPILKKIKPIK